jgi:hypothetical protein
MSGGRYADLNGQREKDIALGRADMIDRRRAQIAKAEVPAWLHLPGGIVLDIRKARRARLFGISWLRIVLRLAADAVVQRRATRRAPDAAGPQADARSLPLPGSSRSDRSGDAHGPARHG